MKPGVHTISGKFVEFENPDPGQICIEDIAHSLANLNRFVGHTRLPLSVARHSIRMARSVKGIANNELAFACLMHDASEAYLGDCPGPLKRLLSDYQRYEAIMDGVLDEVFPRRTGYEAMVHVLDIAALVGEANILCHRDHPAASRVIPDHVTALDAAVDKLDSDYMLDYTFARTETSFAAFLGEYDRLK